MLLKCPSSTVTRDSFWRHDTDNYQRKEMKNNFGEEDGPTCMLYPNTHRLLYFFKHENRLAGRGGEEIKNNESVFQADQKNSSQ